MERSFRAVLRSEEVVVGTPGEPGFHRAKVGRSEVLITRLPDGEAVAFSAECPHQATPLDSATFWDGQLRCGRHLYLYDVHTGENLLPARTSPPEALAKLKPGYLPVHQVEEREGWIFVAEAPEPAPPEPEPTAAQPAPGRPVTAAPAPPAGPVEHAPETVVVRVGEEFDLVLATAPRPAHLWQATFPPGLSVISEGFAPDPPPRHVVRLLASVARDLEVTCTYAAPWDPKPAEIRSFVIRAEP